MRKYTLNVDKMVNRLVPHYIGGRKLVLLLQALLYPLNQIAGWWEQWAVDRRIEASMTSQVIMFEYFLNRKFGHYLKDSSQRIVIMEASSSGLPLFAEDSVEKGRSAIFYTETEKSPSNAVLRWEEGQLSNSQYSFEVCCPDVDERIITQEALANLLVYYIDRYKIAGKNYIITFN